VILATPPDRLAVPRVLLLACLKVTVPVGVPPPATVTLAVRVISWFTLDGFGLAASVVLVVRLLTPTTCVSVAEVLPLKAADESY
jgi:hypothetical protein